MSTTALGPRSLLEAPPPPAPKKSYRGTIILVLIVALLGTGFWYYFFGRKPKVALSIALPEKGEYRPRALWPLGPKQQLLYANGQVKWIDLAEGKEKWTAKMPAQPAGDDGRQEALNARFLKLEQWAGELARKRAALSTPAQIDAFNIDAAKYHAELRAAQSEAVGAAPRQSPSAAVAKPAAPKRVAEQEAAPLPGLRKPSNPAHQLIEERMKKRAAKIETMKQAVATKKANAKTELQKSAVKEDEARIDALLAEQKAEAGALPDAPKETAPSAPSAPVEEAAPEEASLADYADFDMSAPHAALCGDRVWVIEGRHAVAFDRSTGAVKSEVRLSGNAREVFSGATSVIVIAAAGAEGVQLTKLGPSAAPVSLFQGTGRSEGAFSTDSEGNVTPNAQAYRTEFIAGSDSLLRVDIRLKEKRIQARDAIKPGSDKALEDAAQNSAAHSEGEIKAIVALMQNDAARAFGDAKERVDASTYDVTLKRPLEGSIAEWTGTVQGRVQLFSTPTVDLLTAGTKLLAFDRSNKKLWEATLGAPVPIHRFDSEMTALSQPWLESGDRLFFADGAFLSAIETKTGKVLWRLPSVGIRKLQTDTDGNLYVLSDNLSVEALTYVADSSVHDAIPVTMKVAAKDGKIAWKVTQYQDLWVSGKDVYVFRQTTNQADIENQVFDRKKAPSARVKIYKLSRGSGSPMWEWFQIRRPVSVIADHKHVSLLFGDELQIIRSICW